MKIGIILAKSISERVPNKNFRRFNGKPMIHWTIDAAKKSKVFDKIIIATDSDEIIQKFKKYNLSFIKRPKELNKEKYGVDEVMKYCLSNLSEKVEYACCLYACSPLISYKDIKNGFLKIKEKKYKYIFAASNFSHPIERSFKVDKEEIKMISKKFFNTSSKFFTETYHDTGYFYWAKADTWKNEFLSYSSKSSFIKIPNWRAQDLDTLDDLKKVDLVFKSLKKKK
ncbi:NTP transferase domain-containing protein [Candidatus Pelagibacter bacterium]|nr:NTP transferase domain-containing protein [Candidatus Pelagibacter bacterium]MDA8836404.1 NTP transferase domain-containing protein [Candidatus Pelagibacter bacterium]